MTAGPPAPEATDTGWARALYAAQLFAIDPQGLGGLRVRARAGPVRDLFVRHVAALLAPTALTRIPPNIPDSRLLGGLDLAATLGAGRPVAERGLLAEADGGVLLVPMAERLGVATAAHLAAALDTGEVVLERDGIAARSPARFGVLALDEGIDPEEAPPAALLDRLAFVLDLEGLRPDEHADAIPDHAAAVARARTRLPGIVIDEAEIKALCAAALGLGIGSLRISELAVRAARASAAAGGRDTVSRYDAQVAALLVLVPRGHTLPSQEPAEQPETQPPDPGDDARPDEPPATGDAPLEDMVLEAAQAILPPGLLEAELAHRRPRAAASSGRAAANARAMTRGRPVGSRSGDPRTGARLNVLETLRTAAPWQQLRRRERPEIPDDGAARRRLEIRKSDFRVTRYKRRTGITTIVAVDASGSAALNRLAEAKGAVELLLAECYVRRDQVALIAFRGSDAEVVLPPTRSLARAKRTIAGLAGGGGTPLASGILAAAELADTVRRRDEVPVVIFLTDGRANIARDGTPGRPQAEEDALAAARALRETGATAMVIDISPTPRPFAERLAEAMGARHVALPHAGAAHISNTVMAGRPPP